MIEHKLNGIYDTLLVLDERIVAIENNGVPGVKDFFATSALSVLANKDLAKVWSPQDVAEFAYDIAEAMMAERAKRNVS